MPDAYRPDRELGRRKLDAFARLVARDLPEVTRARLTADDFFRFCVIAYAANDDSRWIRRGMRPPPQYRAMADGRDEGLLEVRGDSARAFAEWYEKRPHIGHPFEICRGGNSTHVTLGVTRRDDGWQVYLEGGSTGRMVETARMALALDRAGVPFVLLRGPEMLLKLRGNDRLGIVPEDFRGADARLHFPDGMDVFDTVTMNLLADAWPRLRPSVEWRPIEATCEPLR